MEHVSIDLCDIQGQNWLVMVDRYSGWPFAGKLSSTTTEKVTDMLDSWFTQFGFPSSIKSDNGPQFRDQFELYCRSRGINRQTSSPYNHQSNGLAESAVKNMKKLIAKCMTNKESIDLAIMAFRNCARSNGVSPAQAFLGRRMQDILPSHSSSLNCNFNREKFDALKSNEERIC